MYCSGALDTSTHWNFSASTFSFRAVNEYWMTFGSMTRTYHLANLAVLLFMFFNVSVFFGSISAGRAWPCKAGRRDCVGGAPDARVSSGARTSSRDGAASRAKQFERGRLAFILGPSSRQHDWAKKDRTDMDVICGNVSTLRSWTMQLNRCLLYTSPSPRD